MLGRRFNKSDIKRAEYAAIAIWCNENNATIVDYGTYCVVEALPELALEQLKEHKLQDIASWTEEHITGGFKYNNVTYDSDIDTQITMQGIALNVHTNEFAEKYPTGCPVRGYDQNSSEKTIHMLSADEVLEFCAALSIHIGNCKQTGWILQNRVAEATTKEELDQIV